MTEKNEGDHTPDRTPDECRTLFILIPIGSYRNILSIISTKVHIRSNYSILILRSTTEKSKPDRKPDHTPDEHRTLFILITIGPYMNILSKMGTQVHIRSNYNTAIL